MTKIITGMVLIRDFASNMPSLFFNTTVVVSTATLGAWQSCGLF